jgi:hypothetical protein
MSIHFAGAVLDRVPVDEAAVAADADDPSETRVLLRSVL